MRTCAGFTLVELLVATTVAALLAALALPSYRAQLNQARRSDGIAALMRLEFAQNRFRANNGLYTTNLAALGDPGVSADGHYRLQITAAGPAKFSLQAEPVAGSPQTSDACARLTLEVDGERVTRGPSRACWNL